MFINKVSIYQKHVHEMLRGIPFQSFLRFVKLDSICPLVHVWLKLLGMLLNAHSLPLPQMTYWEFYDHKPSDSQHFWWVFKKLTQIQAEDCEQIERPRISDICVKIKNIYILHRHSFCAANHVAAHDSVCDQCPWGGKDCTDLCCWRLLRESWNPSQGELVL